MEASASRVDVVPAMYAEPQAHGSVEVAVDDLTDPRLVDAGVPEARQAAAQAEQDAQQQAQSQASQENSDETEAAEVTSAARKVTVTGRKILDDVTWLIGPGDRFGIVGANGAGKSTLLKILDGTITPTAGHVNIGKTVKFAVLSQRLDELEKLGKYKIKEVLSRYKPSYIVDGKETTPGQMMERLGFESAQLMTPIKDLSGGQKRRMQLLLILLDEPNVLIMDEPGNDLDTDMLAVMEDLLDTWPGTLIVVSHDRYLLERVTDQQFALIGGKIRHLPGGVQDYLDMTEAIKNGSEVIGNRTRAKIVKNKCAPPFREAVFDIMYGEGISRFGELLDIAVTLELVNKSGSWFSVGDERIGQGRDNAKQYIADHPELAAELEARVRAHLMEVQNSRIKQPAAPAKPVDVSADDFDAE
jgi:ABC-type multidrug transport system ATPase subunit